MEDQVDEQLLEAHYWFAEAHKSLYGCKWSPAIGSYTIDELYERARQMQDEANKLYEQEVANAQS